MEKSIVVIRKPKTFYFDFYWPKDADKNFKHEISNKKQKAFSWE